MKKQSGFTLIEIVMVLVLLGILSAVAVPKYFDMQKQAKQQAANAYVAECQARVNAKFAEQLLIGAKCSDAVTTALNEVTSLDAEASSGYTITVPTGTVAKKAAQQVTITVKDKQNEVLKRPDGTADGTNFILAIPPCADAAS